MNEQQMYNAFDKNRSNSDNQPHRHNASRRGKSVKSTAIPGIGYDDIEEPDDDSADPVIDGPAVGVDRSLGGFKDIFGRIDESSSSDDPDAPLCVPPFEFDEGGVSLPNPDVFNKYPPEVQRKIMEWTDRDIKARRDDESRRQDAILRANIARDKTRTYVPVVIIILCIICAAATGLMTENAIFVLAFLVVALAVIIVMFVNRYEQNKRGQNRPPF